MGWICIYVCIAVDSRIICTYDILILVFWIDEGDVGLLPLVRINVELKTWLTTYILLRGTLFIVLYK